MTFRYTTILFDFDGTLSPSLHLWMRAYQYALEQFGIKLGADEVIKKCFYRPWSELVETFRLPSIREFGAHVQVGLEEAFVEAELFTGVVEFLEECRSRSVNLGIVTSSNKSIVEKVMASHSIAEYFDTVITADDVTNFKPHPQPVLMALAQLKVPPETCLFIGDSAVDLLAARAAKTECALFFPQEHHIFYNFDDLVGHQPHFVFHDYSELKAKVLAEQQLV